ncbi:unnamed protein product, partial [Mesorhabditis belari]|uniref:Nuclear receptor domain-containing protein n=1 Tax=Mesorhabditis belari TaxID=2138241 RepID=A0AAF3ETP2_9BILA
MEVTTRPIDRISSIRSSHDCQVCHSTLANGLHFGARTCAACAAFFRRTISDGKKYICKRSQRCTSASRDGYRKICRACRMKRCLEIGMMPENVQHKRQIQQASPLPLPGGPLPGLSCASVITGLPGLSQSLPQVMDHSHLLSPFGAQFPGSSSQFTLFSTNFPSTLPSLNPMLISDNSIERNQEISSDDEG